MSGLEPIAVVACVAAVVSALHAVAELAKRRRANSEPDVDADEEASCCCGLCQCLPCNTAWRRYRQNRILRRRIMLVAYEIEVAYLVCPKIVRRAIRQSPVNPEYGEDDQLRVRMELVLVDILAFKSEMTGAEDEVQVDMDALLRNCNPIRNRAVWSIASYGFRVAQGFELSYGFDAASFRRDLEWQLRRRQGSKARKTVGSLVLASHRVRVRVVSLPMAKTRGKARGGEGTNEKAHNGVTRIFSLARRQPQSEGGSSLLCGLRLPKIKWPKLRIPKLSIPKLSIPKLQFQIPKLRISKSKQTPWVPGSRRTTRRASRSPAPSPPTPEPSFYQPPPKPRPRPVSPVRPQPAPAGPSRPRCRMTDDEELGVDISAGGAALAGAMLGGPLGAAAGYVVGFIASAVAVNHNHRNCNHRDGEPCYGRH
ncbi:hypothetical protein B0T25DRAFT_560697 [Lasiosphaeria hispida]|uniref:Uncharacterized protein n=1 Tax=Lasiosphaeria hispida TaxID=260671 RepID=A0AAJ0H5E1_9PEZI|nr:hypothetical protein B0T25DRAFT_560697 [Lasiosphaeria hispida]